MIRLRRQIEVFQIQRIKESGTAQAAAPPANGLGKTHWRVRGRRVLDVATRTSSPLRSVDTAGYIYYIRIHMNRRRISAGGETDVRLTIDTLIPESSGLSVTRVAKKTTAVAGNRNVGRERCRTESMNNKLSCPGADAEEATTCVHRLSKGIDK